MARKDVTNVAKKMMMLSTETLQGLKLTGINNTLKMLSTNMYSFVLTVHSFVERCYSILK